MRSAILPALLIGTVLITGCKQYAYYQSPFQTHTSTYKTIPLHADSVRSAIYASGVFTVGGANHQLRDAVVGGIGSVYRSHTSKYVQGFYGLTGMIGNYDVKSYRWRDSIGNYNLNNNLDDSLISTMSGSKIWGGWGVTGGISFSIPFRKHQWRVIGVEGSWQREFGRYLDFRQKIPDTAANLIDHSRNYFTLAITSDLVYHTRRGQVGYKVAAVFSTRPLTRHDSRAFESPETPGYFSQTFHLSTNKVTGFTQLNIGSHALGWQLGMSYQLGR